MKLLLITEEYQVILYKEIMARMQGTGDDINTITTQLLNALEATPENIKKLKVVLKEAEMQQAKATKQEKVTQKKLATPKKSKDISKKKTKRGRK